MTHSFGTGLTGDINIDTTTLNVIGGGVVQTLGVSDGAPSGNISIRATDSMTLASPDGSSTSLNEYQLGEGPALSQSRRADLSFERSGEDFQCHVVRLRPRSGKSSKNLRYG